MADQGAGQGGFDEAMQKILVMPVDEVLGLVPDDLGSMNDGQLAFVGLALLNKAKLCANLASVSIRAGDQQRAAEASDWTRVLLSKGEPLLVATKAFRDRPEWATELEEAKREIAAMLNGVPSAAEKEGVRMAERALANRSQSTGCGGLLLLALLLVLSACVATVC